MKINYKYTKIKEKWLEIYKICKSKLDISNKITNSVFYKIKNTKITLLFKAFKNLIENNLVTIAEYKNLNIIDKYLLKSFSLTLVAVISVLILVIVGRLFVKLLGYVIDGRFEIEMIFSLLFLSASKSIILLLPFAIMIGLIIALSKFYKDSEIYALKASGNYKATFMKLFFIITIPSFLIILILNIFTSPYLISEIQKKKIEAATTSEIGLTSPGKFIQMKDKNWIIFVEEIENKISKRIFIKTSENNKVSIETAEEGDEFIKDGTRILILKNGQRYTGTPGTGNFQVMKYDKHEVKLINPTPDFSLNYRMKSIFDLMGDNNLALSNAEIQWRLFSPLSVIILILFAFIFSDIKPRQNKYSNILAAIIIYFLYSNLVIVSVNQIQKDTYLFSYIGTWWVHILAVLTCYLIYFLKRKQLTQINDIKIILKNIYKKI